MEKSTACLVNTSTSRSRNVFAKKNTGITAGTPKNAMNTASKNEARSKLVVIPAFNEEKNLPSVLSDVKKHLPDFDIVVVNDGSLDRTAEIAEAYGAAIVSHPINIGYGVAVQTGFRYASHHNYDTVVLMDADGQHNAADAPELVQALDVHRADMIIGSRFMKQQAYKTTLARRVGRNIFSLIINIVTHRHFVDITSGYKIFNRRAVAFLSLNYPVDFPDAEVIITLLLSGFNVAEAPANFRQRTCGRSMFSLSKKIYYPFKCLLAIFTVVMRASLTKKE
jgi:glycosyltransferase involved in cell wall biosynthesis